jgi:hypothetical protein
MVLSNSGGRKPRDSGPQGGVVPPHMPVDPHFQPRDSGPQGGVVPPYIPGDLNPPYLPPPSNGYCPAPCGDEIIIIETSKFVEEIKKKTVKEVHHELKKEIAEMSVGVLALLTCGDIAGGEIIVKEGEHFMEEMMRKFEIEFFEKWKREFVFPRIQRWLEIIVVEFIVKIVEKRTEEIIKKFSKSIEIIEEKYKLEIIELERRHRDLLIVIVKRAWEEYEKKMTETEIVKEVRFKFAASEEKEAWGEIIEEIIPEILDCVPKVWCPEVHFGEHHHPKHHHPKHNDD